MYADTVESIKVGFTDTNSHSANFGLIERPQSKLKAIKEITQIKVTNKGIIYVDTAQGIGARKDNDSHYTIELDDELINGATLEVSYRIQIKNEGEKDTLFNYFEGDAKYGNNQHRAVTTSAKLVYDYPEKIGFDTQAGWTKDGIDTSILSPEVRNNINSETLILKRTDNTLAKELAPGESTDPVTVTFSKLMTIGGSDELRYENKVEVVSRSNGVGRRDALSIAGNYNPKTKAPVEPDTAMAVAEITDPMGQPRIYYGVGIAALAILIGGIALIKKKVIVKK